MIRCLNATDTLISLFILLLTFAAVLFSARIPDWWLFILVNLVALAYAYLVALLRHRTGLVPLRWLHDWNAIPLLVFCYKEVYFLIQPIYGRKVFDGMLIAMDRRLFGTDPTVWLARFSSPWGTEVLQVAYSSFYLFFLIIGFEIYRRRNPEQFSGLRFSIAYGFILSYIGYFLLPAVGPRFTLHDYARINIELPGVALTPYLRWFVDAGESIPARATNSLAAALAQRDAFPSGHTMMTLVLICLGFRWRTRSRYFVLAMGLMLIVATVYLRYHYVVDVLAGALWAAFCVLTTRRIFGLVRAGFRVDP